MKLSRIVIAATVLSALAPLAPASAENIQHTQQLLATRQCPNCDLNGAGLVLANLAGANLQGADLRGANLSRANLAGADLSGANLSGTSLFGVNLTGANLSGANLNGADLRSAYLSNANLLNTNLTSTQLLGVRGMPTNIGTAEDFYKLGVIEAQAGNYRNAVDYYNQALNLKPDLASVYFARSMSRADLGDFAGATQDAAIANKLFATQGNSQGQELSKQLAEAIVARQKPTEPRTAGGGDFMSLLGSVSSFLLQVLF
ncbi:MULTISPECIES: pentapeptide repeat-containing protein [unclassified Microcoleus]|uniref:pentapeptide repeat-containing protein n=1 Tax=unclassified Microcoleus TaxID=2642155 RepID=UPI00312B7004